MLEKVRKLAGERGMTIHALEQKSGVGNGTISGWDKSKPNLSTIEKVANALGIPVKDLLE